MRRIALIVMLLLVGAIGPVSQQATASSPCPVLPHPHHLACPATPIHCDAEVVTGDSPNISTALTPQQFHSAYNLPCRPYGSVRGICPQPRTFGGQTIAIVDA